MAESGRPSGVNQASSAAAAAPAGDPDAIESLVRRWAGIIRAAAARYRIMDADMDELVQDVRLRLWRASQRHESGPTAPAGYVHRAAVSAAIDMVRRQRRERSRQRVAIEEVADQIADSSGSVGQDEDRLVAALERAVAKVSTSRRPAVRLHLAGRSLEEITRVMEWSPARARNLLYRGLEELRACLSEEGVA